MARNKCLEGYLRCYAGAKPGRWSQWLALVEWWYNTNYHSATKFSLFEALYGYAPPRFLSYISGTIANDSLDQHLRTWEHILTILKENLKLTQSRMKQYADIHKTERKFEEGNCVYLWLQPYRQKSLAGRRNLKLSPQFYGPFQVNCQIGAIAY